VNDSVIPIIKKVGTLHS